jgi:cell division septation protein DedD
MKHFYFITLLLVLSLVQMAQVTMVTNIPTSIAPNVSLNVEVKLNKGSISNFSKYELDVPEGFSASEGNSKTGYFTFEKNRIKIVWVTLPTESEFVVSFKLKTPATVGPVVLNHKFFYIESGVKKEVVGQQIDVKVDPAGVTKTFSYLPEQPEEVINASEPMNPPVKVNLPVQTTPTVVNTPSVTPTTATVAPIVPVAASSISQNGITYLVQIGTFGADPDKAKYSSLGKVTVEKVGAVYKVLIGDFNTKEEAFKKRDELTAKGYNGFVVTYQNGQRAK